MFKNLSITKKMGALIVVSSLFMSIVAFTGYYFLSQAVSLFGELYNDSLLPVQKINDSRVQQRGVMADLLELMITTDNARNKQLADDIKRRGDIYNEEINELKKGNLDAYEKKAYAELDALMEKYRASRDRVIALAMQNKNAEAYQLYTLECAPLAEMTQKKLVEISQYQIKNAETMWDNQTFAAKKAYAWLVGLSLGALIFAGALGWAITRAVAQPLAASIIHLGIMAKGDFSMDVPKAFIERGDEFGIMARAFEALTKSMRLTLKQVAQSSEQVAAASEELTASAQQSAAASNNIAESIQQVARGSEKQVGAVNDTSAIVQEISATMEEVSATAAEMATMSEQTVAAAIEGKTSADRAVNQMGAVGAGAKQAQTAAVELKVSSAQIGEIVGLISTIAGQTNLLALNAAIEAARAGEQGRGFAVVAEEVRKLAEQSETAAQQIKTLVEQNHASIGNVVGAIDTAIQDITQGVELVNVAGSNFGAINGQIGRVTEQVHVIAKAINEVAFGSQRIVGSIKEVEMLSRDAAAESQNVSAATEEQSASMEEIAASSQALAKLAVDLQSAVAKFRI